MIAFQPNSWLKNSSWLSCLLNGRKKRLQINSRRSRIRNGKLYSITEALEDRTLLTGFTDTTLDAPVIEVSAQSDSSPTVSWKDVVDAVDYEILLYDVQKGQLLEYQPNHLETSFTPTDLIAPGTVLEFWVRGHDTAGTPGDWSRPAYTKIDDPSSRLIETPRLVGPADVVTDSNPVASWIELPNAASYELEVYSREIGQRVYQTGSIVGSIYRLDESLTEPGTYQAVVRAHYPDGFTSGWATRDFRFENSTGTETIPQLTGPASRITDSSPTITWQSFPSAESYDVQIIDVASGMIVNESSSVEGTSYGVTTPLKSPNNYQARVRAHLGNELITEWGELEFRVLSALPIPPAPIIDAPPLQDISDTTPTISWSKPPHARSYQVQIYDLDRGVLVQDHTNLDGPHFTFLEQIGLGRYQFYARGINAANEPGLWSQPIILNQQTATHAEPFAWQDAVVDNVSPTEGEVMVSVTREAIIRFSHRVDPSTVNNDSIKVLALGDEIPGRVVLSSTRRFARFYPNDPWPASTELRVIVDGDKITRGNGTPFDADGDGVPGGVLSYDFRTLPLTRIAGTNVFGFVRDSYSGEPVVGATIRVDAFPEANGVTDENGRFELVDMPAPEFFVHIDGSTATSAPEGFVYPNVGKPFHSVPGQTVQLEMNGDVFDSFLPPMAIGDVQPLSETEPTQIGFGAEGMNELQRMFPEVNPEMFSLMKVTFEPNAAVDDQGIPARTATIIPVPADRIPAPLPHFLDSRLVVSIQAPGATSFDIPASVTFPNLDGLEPGTKADIYSFNHDAGRFESIGTGTVSEDGLSIVSDPGVGILAPGWHVVAAPIGCNVGHSPLDLSSQSTESNSGNNGFAASAANDEIVTHLTNFIYLTDDNTNQVLDLEWSSEISDSGSCGDEVTPLNPDQRLEVTVNIEGPLSRFLSKTGSESLSEGSRSFVIIEGSGDSRSLKANAKSHIQTLGFSLSDSTNEYLFGAKMTVTESLVSANGNTETTITEHYIYKWINTSSVIVDGGVAKMKSSPTIGFSAFQRTFDAELVGDVVREKRVVYHVPNSFETKFVGLTDSNVFDLGDDAISGRGTTEWEFDPDEGRRFEAFFDIQAEGHKVGEINLSGLGTRPTRIEVNRDKYEQELEKVIRGIKYAWHPGADEFPGIKGVDDDGILGIDNPEEYGLGGAAGGDKQVYVYDYPGLDAVIITKLKDSTGTEFDYFVFDHTKLTVTVDPDGNATDPYEPYRFFDSSGRYTDSSLLQIDFDDFLPTNGDAGADGKIGTADDVFSVFQETFIESFVSDQGADLVAAVEEDYDAINGILSKAYVVVEGGIGDQNDVDVEMDWEDVTYFPNLGAVFGSADADRDRTTLQSILSSGTIPLGAKQVALSEFLNLNDSNRGKFGISINIDWTSDATFAEYVANTVSHELAHTFGILDAYRSQGVPDGGTANCVRGNCDPFDIMQSGSQSDGNLFFKNWNVTLLQAAMGIQDNTRDGLDDAIKGFKDTFNLPDSSNGIREENVVELVDPEIELVRNGLFFFGFGDESNSFQMVSADGSGGDLIQVEYAIHNRGVAPLTVSDVRIDGGQAGFSIDATDAVEITLAVGELALFTVTFDPKEVGLFEDILIVESDAGGVPDFRMTLTGEAIPASSLIEIERLRNNNFGGVRLLDPAVERNGIFEIVNRGASALEINDIRIAEGSGEFAILGFDGTPVVLATGESMQFGASYQASEVGLQRTVIEIVTNDPDRPILTVGVMGTGVTELDRPQPVIGRDYVHMFVDRPEIPGRPNRRDLSIRNLTNRNGNFEFRLPTEESYTIGMYDPDSGLVAHGSGETAQAGQARSVTNSLIFGASYSPDSDYDGLPDDIEDIRGTEKDNTDTDGDGIDDFTEDRRGDNPLTGSFPTGVIAQLPIGAAKHIVVEGDTAYVVSEFAGRPTLTLVDISEFDNPIVLGRLALDGIFASNVAVDPRLQIAVVGGGLGGTHFIDIADPMLPRLIETIEVNAAFVELLDGVAYVADGILIRTIDLVSLEEHGSLQLPSAAPIDTFAKQGNLLYAYQLGNTFSVVDTTQDPPVLLGSRTTPDVRQAANVDLFVGGRTAYIAQFGLATVSVTNPRFPGPLTEPPRVYVSSTVAANGSGLLLVGVTDAPDAVDVFDVSTPGKYDDIILRIPNVNFPQDIAIASGIAYSAGGAGLTVINYLPFDVDGVAPAVTIDLGDVDDIDIDPNTEGIQMIAGTSIGLMADVTDDVQVRDVELLVNGEVVRRDVSFPFDFTPAARTGSDGSTMTLQLRATDTGRNAGLSEILVIDVLPDNNAPSVISITPSDGDTLNQFDQLRTVRVKFDEPINPQSVNAESIRLTHNGVVFLPQDVVLQFEDTFAQLTYAPFGGGDFEIVIDTASISDRSGNVIGGLPISSSFTVMPDLTPPNIVSILPADGSFGTTDLNRIEIRFSEAMAVDTLNAENIQLQDALGNVVIPLDFQIRSRGRFVFVEYESLSLGGYQIVLNGLAITDRSGNPLSNNTVISSFSIIPPGDGTRLFPDRIFELPSFPSKLIATDLDGDGDQDIVGGAHQIFIAHNQGDGTFAKASTFDISATSSSSIDVGDLNNDGFQDIVTAGGTSQQQEVELLLSDGLDGYAPASTLVTTGTPTLARIDDFNNDGNLDVAITQSISAGVRFTIIPGNGDGTFAESYFVDNFALLQSAGDMIVTDITGDGQPEIVVLSNFNSAHAGISAMSVNEDGSFGTIRQIAGLSFSLGSDFELEDLDADGDLDLVLRAQPRFQSLASIYVAINDGEGNFTDPVIVLGSVPGNFSLDDFNTDGILDIVLTQFGRLDVRFGNGDGTFGGLKRYEVPGVSGGNTLTSDFDGENGSDILTIRSQSLLLLSNNGDGTFPVQPTYESPTSLRSTILADLDHDGDLDLVATNSNDKTISVFESNGDGTFVVAPELPLGNSPDITISVDVNNDGILDVLTAGSSGSVFIAAEHNVAVQLGDGIGGFTSRKNFVVGFNPLTITTEDFNEDGFLDFATSSSSDSTLSVLFGDGLGNFSEKIDLRGTIIRRFHTVVAFDADNNGTIDLVASTSSNTGTVIFFSGNGDGTFGDQTETIIADRGLGAMVSTDLDNDGNIDLVVAVPNRKRIVFLQSQGDGSFIETSRLNTNNAAENLHLADIDHDGILDLLSVNKFDGVFVFLGNPDGTFSDSESFTAGPDGEPANAKSTVSGDFDGDGDLDFVVANDRSGTVSFLRNEGSPLFAAPEFFTSRPNGGVVEAADLDGDGDLDLIVTSEGQSSTTDISILLNDGNGFFAEPVSFAAGDRPFHVAAADFDGDEDIDLAVSHNGSTTISILLNDGNATFAEPVETFGGVLPLHIEVGDVDNDGDSDLLVLDNATDRIGILQNDGNAGFNLIDNFEAAVGPGGFTLSDFDNDGNLDMAINAGNQAIAIYPGNGDATFGEATQLALLDASTLQMTANDLNADGFNDLIVVTNRRSIAVWMARGDGTFDDPVFYRAGSSPNFVVAGDVDGDGDIDLAISDNTNIDVGTLQILRNHGDGSFVARIDLRLVGFYTSVTTLDANGDGILDLAATEKFDNTLDILIGKGDGQFDLESRLVFGVGGKPSSVTAIDLDRDGDSDLVVANNESQTISILDSRGDGTFVARTDFPQKRASLVLATADLNDDGNPDVVTVSGSTIEVSLGNGSLEFRESTEFVAGSGLDDIALADVTGDGIIDAVLVARQGLVFIVPGLGGGTFGTPSQFETGDAEFLDVADLNDDGVLDIVTLNPRDNQVSVLLGIGGGQFQAQTTYTLITGTRSTRPLAMALGDVDRDGFIDIVTANRTGTGFPDKAITLLLNNQDGTFGQNIFISATSGGNSIGEVSLDDVNADGILDIITGDQANGGTFEILIGNGDGTFQPRQIFSGGDQISGFVVGDIDNDGDLDLVAQGSGTISPRLNAIFEADNLRLEGYAGDVSSSSTVLRSSDLQFIAEAAVTRFVESGIDSQAEKLLNEIELIVTDLPGDILGQQMNDVILIDIDAASTGWFVDATPFNNGEFSASRRKQTALDSEVAKRVDLLSVVMHEMGHVLGVDHSDEGMMSETLPVGVRRNSTMSDDGFTDDLFGNLHREILDELLTI